MILPNSSETHACVLHFLSQGEEEFDVPQPPRGHVLHRHMRTIHEVRTLVTRVITDVYYVDGAEVERKVTEVIFTLGLCGKFISVEKLPWHFTATSPSPFPVPLATNTSFSSVFVLGRYKNQLGVLNPVSFPTMVLPFDLWLLI